jgi:hypothetical protein
MRPAAHPFIYRENDSRYIGVQYSIEGRAGLVSRLFLGFFVNPVLYEMVARDGDVLQV